MTPDFSDKLHVLPDYLKDIKSCLADKNTAGPHGQRGMKGRRQKGDERRKKTASEVEERESQAGQKVGKDKTKGKEPDHSCTHNCQANFRGL
ncbi:hypothetical protein ILYODFUR_006022 [Ilyodon furcidens]|uniref:Uncharacterized protein n=1 Tax=Ilyodon furcidens TaxID=33524 RepID=A0ABV0TGD8_9TELE